MKKVLLFATMITLSMSSKSQDYIGLSTGNYAGINGIMLQPASVADNRYQFDFNLFSTNIGFQNNYLGFTRNYFVKEKFSFKDFNSFQDFKSRILTENDIKGNNAYFHLQNRVQLPFSFLLSTGKKSGIALNFQSRTSLAFNNVNPSFAKQAYEWWKYPNTYNQIYNTDGFSIDAVNWFEAGFTYGRVLLNTGKSFLKMGVTGKYLAGVSSWNLEAAKLKISASNDSTMNIAASNVKYSHSKSNISANINSSYRPDASSWGADAGLVYEFRGRINKFKFLKYDKDMDDPKIKVRRDKNKYTFKVGVSLVDIGSLKFNSVLPGSNLSYNSSINFNNIAINNVKDFDSMIARNGVYYGDSNATYTVAMPTALSGQFDLHIIKGLYVNAMAYVPFTALNKNADYRVFTPTYYTVTPRFETRAFGLYVPLSVTDTKTTKNYSVGTTLRVGPLFVGTGNLLTIIKKDNITSADIHAGFKLPLAYGKPSKAKTWFKKLTSEDDDKEITVVNNNVDNREVTLKNTTKLDTVIIEGPNGTEQKIIVEKKEIIKENTNENKPQPIQIIINNYGTNGSKQTEIINTDGQNINTIDLQDLNNQIEFLKEKLNQKEELIKEYELQQSNIKDNKTLDKKKIDSLKEAYNNTHFNNNGKTTQSLSVAVLQQELETLNQKNKALNTQLDNIIYTNRLLQMSSNNANETVINKTYLNDLKAYHDDMSILKNKVPKMNTQVAKLNDTITTIPQVITTTKNISHNEKNLDYSSFLTKSESNNLMTKSDYQNIKNELAIIKEQINNTKNTPTTIITTSNQTENTNNTKKGKWVFLGRRNPIRVDTVYSKGSTNTNTNTITKTDLKVIRDTIYLDKIVEKEVVKIIRDTITNTVTHNVEKTNYVPKVETKIEYVKQELMNLPPDVILFDVGQFFIKKQYNSRLDFYASQLKKYPDIKVLLTGHTDKTGNVEKNKVLSKNRANAVRNYLQMKGVDKNRITMEGVGSDAPASDNNTHAGKSQNRRVDIQFVN